MCGQMQVFLVNQVVQFNVHRSKRLLTNADGGLLHASNSDVGILALRPQQYSCVLFVGLLKDQMACICRQVFDMSSI